jgi:hypothetical protein
MRISAVILIVLALAFPHHARATLTTGPVDPKRALDPLIYAHVVVECTIKAVRKRAVTLAEMFPSGSPNETIGIFIAELSDVVVLRGCGSPTEVEINIDLSPRKLIGERMILCGYWLPTLNMFTVPSDRLTFRRDGDRWVGMRNPVAIAPGTQVSMTTQELNALMHETETSTLASKADLIVIGRVASVLDSTIAAPEQQQYRVRKVVLEVERVLKGAPRMRSAWFLVSRAGDCPPWHTVTPGMFGVDETWMAFLRRDGDIYYPLGGVNGLLLIEGQKVIFDRSVQCPYSRTALIREVSKAVSE